MYERINAIVHLPGPTGIMLASLPGYNSVSVTKILPVPLNVALKQAIVSKETANNAIETASQAVGKLDRFSKKAYEKYAFMGCKLLSNLDLGLFPTTNKGEDKDEDDEDDEEDSPLPLQIAQDPTINPPKLEPQDPPPSPPLSPSPSLTQIQKPIQSETTPKFKEQININPALINSTLSTMNNHKIEHHSNDTFIYKGRILSIYDLAQIVANGRRPMNLGFLQLSIVESDVNALIESNDLFGSVHQIRRVVGWFYYRSSLSSENEEEFDILRLALALFYCTRPSDIGNAVIADYNGVLRTYITNEKNIMSSVINKVIEDIINSGDEDKLLTVYKSSTTHLMLHLVKSGSLAGFFTSDYNKNTKHDEREEETETEEEAEEEAEMKWLANRVSYSKLPDFVGRHLPPHVDNGVRDPRKDDACDEENSTSNAIPNYLVCAITTLLLSETKLVVLSSTLHNSQKFSIVIHSILNTLRRMNLEYTHTIVLNSTYNVADRDSNNDVIDQLLDSPFPFLISIVSDEFGPSRNMLKRDDVTILDIDSTLQIQPPLSDVSNEFTLVLLKSLNHSQSRRFSVSNIEEVIRQKLLCGASAALFDMGLFKLFDSKFYHAAKGGVVPDVDVDDENKDQIKIKTKDGDEKVEMEIGFRELFVGSQAFSLWVSSHGGS